jgi:hypothetical protein
MGIGGAADVEMDQLVQEGLQHVAAADAGIGGDREAELAGDGEAETVGAFAGAADLELRRGASQRPVREDRQPVEARHLLVESDARDQVVGARPRRRRLGRRRCGATSPTPQPWQRGHQ